MRASTTRYSLPAIALHWLIALAIIGTFFLGWTMADIPGITPTKLKYYSWHKWAGVTIFGLACLRLLWRLTHQPPAYDRNMPQWQQNAAHGAHALLYFLIFAIPLTGYFYSLAAGIPVTYLGIWPMPVWIGPDAELRNILKLAHYWLNMLLLGVFVLHVLAVAKHQFIDRDRTLQRMLP
ncbi:MAG: cytochrome b [Oxalicibacterium faecigallinarum]|uniref:cytochrome b n=1 Tax=Oxalicibacterium faecigallinarum TaxID=573741 RepID=UPI002807CC8C|nr:cytochrome b [Oxalicibacterium faecigallinarum]MDQ7968955.1 cytochrome b [Oxalicibacterium faecigallinarum]